MIKYGGDAANGQGRCAANMVRWKQSSDPRCSCGEIQTMSHIVDDCIETRFPGGLPAFHLADEAAVQWIGALLCIFNAELKQMHVNKYSNRKILRKMFEMQDR